MGQSSGLLACALVAACGRYHFEPLVDAGEASDEPWPTFDALWTWMGGPDITDQAGTYGVRGVATPGNWPGARDNGASWVVGDTFWLFGGSAFDEVGAKGLLNDLWRFDPIGGQWTWIHGSARASGATATYGTRGQPDPANVPGGRNDATYWIDGETLWVVGGNGRDGAGVTGTLDDVWRYDIDASTWTWVHGRSSADQPGIYGVPGVPDPASTPGARSSSMLWTVDGLAWLFGGNGVDAVGGVGRLGDLWRYDPNANVWTWVAGSDRIDGLAVHGTQGVPDPANAPGARHAGCTFSAPDELWLFGGSTPDGQRNDLWRYTISAQTWTWVAGPGATRQQGVYGTRGAPDAGSVPGARVSHVCLTDPRGNFWLFGGRGFDSSGTVGSLNDVWMYARNTGVWTWIAGSAVADQVGSYGTVGVPDATNAPGSRMQGGAWSRADGSLWVFGGDIALGSMGPATGGMSDLWRFAMP